MNVSLHGTIGVAVADYTGRTPVAISAMPDPNVPGVVAIRATMRGNKTLDFLVRVPLKKVTSDDLEECAFATWPPEVVR